LSRECDNGTPTKQNEEELPNVTENSSWPRCAEDLTMNIGDETDGQVVDAEMPALARLRMGLAVDG